MERKVYHGVTKILKGVCEFRDWYYNSSRFRPMSAETNSTFTKFETKLLAEKNNYC